MCRFLGELLSHENSDRDSLRHFGCSRQFTHSGLSCALSKPFQTNCFSQDSSCCKPPVHRLTVSRGWEATQCMNSHPVRIPRKPYDSRGKTDRVQPPGLSLMQTCTWLARRFPLWQPRKWGAPRDAPVCKAGHSKPLRLKLSDAT